MILIFSLFLSCIADQRLNSASCTVLELTANVKEYICKKSWCKVICEPGSTPVGKRRIKCSKKGDTPPSWSSDIGQCHKCQAPSSIDSRNDIQLLIYDTMCPVSHTPTIKLEL